MEAKCKIIENTMMRLIEDLGLSDSYCSKCIFLNDGNKRKYIEKGPESWINTNDFDKLIEILAIISNQVILRHHVLNHRPLSKGVEQRRELKTFLEKCNWGSYKEDMITDVIRRCELLDKENEINVI